MLESIKIDQLKDAINEALENYAEDVTEQLKLEVKLTNREALRMIKRKSPNPSFSNSNGANFKPPFKQPTGRYKKGWSNKKMFENSQSLRYYIYNKTDWQLTHLLEYGHVKFIFGRNTGQRVRAYPHIKPTVEWAKNRLPNGLKARLK